MSILKDLKEQYLNWRTGTTAEERIWQKWIDVNVVIRASTVENKLMHFKHIIEVKPERWFDYSEPFGWIPVKDARKFLYPSRPLGDNAVWIWVRGDRNQWDGFFHEDELGGRDCLFVATNNDRDAMLIALKYSS